MKHKSRLFLLIALILAGIGLVLLAIGAMVSKSQGSDLFAKDLGNGEKGYVYTYDKLDGQLKIESFNTEITIVGNASENKIEIVNFNENRFNYSENDAMITVTEFSDMSSAFAFWGQDFAFKGLRFLPKFASESKFKAIRVFIKEGEGFSDLILHTTGGKVSISDMNLRTTYRIECNGTSVSLNNVKTESSVSVSDKSGQEDIILNNVSAKSITLDMLKADISGSVTCDVLDIWDKSGSSVLDCSTLTFSDILVELNSNARIALDGNEYPSPLVYPQNTDNFEKDGDIPLYAEFSITGDDLSIELDTPLEAIEIKTE